MCDWQSKSHTQKHTHLNTHKRTSTTVTDNELPSILYLSQPTSLLIHTHCRACGCVVPLLVRHVFRPRQGSRKAHERSYFVGGKVAPGGEVHTVVRGNTWRAHQQRPYRRSAVRASSERSHVSTILPSKGRNFSSGGSWLGCAGGDMNQTTGGLSMFIVGLWCES
jgi:hypothetical protein